MSNQEEIQRCPYAAYCGGCTMQGIDYQEQLKRKQEKMNSLFGSLFLPLAIKGAKEPLHYRNKVQFTFGKDEKGRIFLGNYAPDSHILIPVKDCLICDEEAVKFAQSVCTLANRYRISIFNEHTYKGALRHILIRTTSLEETMVVLVSGSPHIYHEEELVRDLLKKHPSIKTVVKNLNSRHTSMILGEKNITLYGKGYITDELLGCRFRISPSSFYQVNKTQTAVLYQTAIDFADLKGEETLLDTYCGTGTIGILMSKKAKKVIGVEINPSAVKDAVRNAKNNHIDNIEFLCDDAGRFMRRMASSKRKIDAVVMDPPRSGSDETFLRSLCQLSPKKVIYISCGPETLRRDLNYLVKRGYKIEKLQPVDMFPYTDHVECVVLMSRVEK